MTTFKDLRLNKGKQYQYDKMLSDVSISGLTFLTQKYDGDLKEFRNNHDLNNQEEAQQYKEMQQRKKMISTELNNRVRMLENENLYSKDIHFNSNYDIIIHEDNGNIKVLRPSFNEDIGVVEIIEIEEDNVRK